MINALFQTDLSIALYLFAGLLGVVIAYACINKNKSKWLFLAIVPFFLVSFQLQKTETEDIQKTERAWIQRVFEAYETDDLTIYLQSETDAKRVYTVETGGGDYQAVFNEDSSMFELVYISGENLNGRLQVLSALNSVGLSETNLSYISDKEYVATGLSEDESYAISLENHLVMAVVDSSGDILLQNEDDNDAYSEKAKNQEVETSYETNEEREVKE